MFRSHGYNAHKYQNEKPKLTQNQNTRLKFSRSNDHYLNEKQYSLFSGLLDFVSIQAIDSDFLLICFLVCLSKRKETRKKTEFHHFQYWNREKSISWIFLMKMRSCGFETIPEQHSHKQYTYEIVDFVSLFVDLNRSIHWFIVEFNFNRKFLVNINWNIFN